MAIEVTGDYWSTQYQLKKSLLVALTHWINTPYTTILIRKSTIVTRIPKLKDGAFRIGKSHHCEIVAS